MRQEIHFRNSKDYNLNNTQRALTESILGVGLVNHFDCLISCRYRPVYVTTCCNDGSLCKTTVLHLHHLIVQQR